MKYKMNKPYKFEIELTEGCNLFCEFCAIRTFWKNKEDRILKFMTIDLANQLSESINSFTGDKIRIDFAAHGEPTLNPNLFDIISSFRNNVPKAQIVLTTNGVTLRKNGLKYVSELFDKGINIIYMSNYNNNNDSWLNEIDGVDVVNFYDCDKKKYNPYYYHGNKTKWILKLGTIRDQTSIIQRRFDNMGGNVDFALVEKYGIKKVNIPLQKNCSHPFHDMVIDYDGTVVGCCLDWKREMIMGKFPEETVHDIWFGEGYNLLRILLSRKNRNFGLCSKCDYFGGVRLGLLPKSDSQETSVILKTKLMDYISKYNDSKDNTNNFVILDDPKITIQTKV